MTRYVDAEYVKAVMLNDRLMQGNAEFTLYAQQVETQVNAMPSIEIIRCGECKYYYNKDPEQIPTANIMCGHMHPDDFCSYGERSSE